jgi:hypothetical protein
MVSLIVTLIVASVLLSLTGALQPAAASALVIGGGLILIFQNYQLHRDRHQLMLRSHELGATSALAMRHLGGLPFPGPTPGRLFARAGTLRFETEHDVWQLQREQIVRLAIIRPEELPRLRDQALMAALQSGSSRLFSLVREKIRLDDANIRRATVLFLTYRPEPDDDSMQASAPEDVLELIILSCPEHAKLKNILEREGLSDRLTIVQTQTGV